MGKNHRLKKKVKSEKAKTHITSKTKFLPKGQNVTNTAFKIRPIVLQEQLKEKDENQLLSKRKLTINELITKLKHYNENVKADACHELQLMFKENSTEIVQKHLASIIQTASILIQDKERKVRRACVKLINEILQNVEFGKLVPFFTYISTNLRCAMTNICKNIQEDSLLLLDSLLENTPGLVAENAEKIFPDFLTLISKLRNDSEVKRTLTLNLGSKITSVNWRIKVLSRLYAILKAMNFYHVQKQQLNDFSTCKNHKFDEKNVFALYKPGEIYENSFDFFNTRTNIHDNFFNKHLVGIIPLLYETWMEVVPEKSLQKRSGGETTVLNEESAAVLTSIVHIVDLLHYHVDSMAISTEIFGSKETAKFFDHLLVYFPYGQNRRSNKEISKDISKLFTINDDPKCVEENLLIAKLFFKRKANLNQKNGRSQAALVMAYINKLLNGQITPENLKNLTPILREILSQPLFWRRFGVNSIELSDNLVKFHQISNLTPIEKCEILEILTEDTILQCNSHLEVWLGNLPSMLCKIIDPKLVDIILKMCQRNNKNVQLGVVSHLEEILEMLKNSESRLINIKVFYIFYYVPQFSREQIELIRECAKQCQFPQIVHLFG